MVLPLVLSEIAIKEPQAALSAYTKSICHRWSFIQRTLPNIKDQFLPLEDCIRNTFIPSLVGRSVSDLERQIFSLPVRLGGMGLANPVETADREYDASKTVTACLSELILQQVQDIAQYDKQRTADTIKDLKAAKEIHLTEKFQAISDEIGENPLKRCLILNREKGVPRF